MWDVRLVKQNRAGEIRLARETERRGALPETVSVSIGVDGRGGFLLRRSEGTIETESPTDGLTDSSKKCATCSSRTLRRRDEGLHRSPRAVQYALRVASLLPLVLLREERSLDALAGLAVP
jgi:hypothetical protein